MASNIVVYPNILTQEQCLQIISDVDVKHSTESSYFSGYEQDYGIKKKNCIEHPLVKYISEQNNYVLDSAALVYYPEKSFNGMHADNSVNDGSEWKRIKDWKRTAIVFCNNNFEGGELIYPEQGCVFIPRVGTMVEAPADPEFLHEVRPVLQGERYTLVLRILN